eukprot:1307638-Rhodomonas_salina.1
MSEGDMMMRCLVGRAILVSLSLLGADRPHGSACHDRERQRACACHSLRTPALTSNTSNPTRSNAETRTRISFLTADGYLSA